VAKIKEDVMKRKKERENEETRLADKIKRKLRPNKMMVKEILEIDE